MLCSSTVIPYFAGSFMESNLDRAKLWSCGDLLCAGSRHEAHKRHQKPKLATPMGRHGLTFSSAPHVPRVSLRMLSEQSAHINV